MKPYGNNNLTPGAGPWKKDYHLHNKNHRKIRNWWEYFAENTISRTTIKKKVKEEINKGIGEYE